MNPGMRSLRIGLALITAGMAILGWPSAQTLANDAAQARTAGDHMALVSGTEGGTEDGAKVSGRNVHELAEADEYNRRLARGLEDGAADGNDAANGYDTQLNAHGGVMGTLLVPRIGLQLPIRHGTDEATLSRGVGHLRGTSLPVGGVSTHAVLTSHRGLQTATLFTRIGELEEGDPIYVTASGRSLAYRVEAIHRSLTPDEASRRLGVVEGQDRLTLLTCTPVLVNTHRLLVSAVRMAMPDATALPERMPLDSGAWARRWRIALPLPPAAALAFSMAAGPRHRRRHGQTTVRTADPKGEES